MEKVFLNEKKNIEQELQLNVPTLQQDFEALKLKLGNDLNEKDHPIHQLKKKIEKFQENLKLNTIKKEETELDTSLSKQQSTFYHKLNQVQELVKTSDHLVTQIYYLRTYYDEIDDKLSKYIDWQDTTQGRAANLPHLEESIKDIVFGDQDIKMKSAELAIIKAKNISSNISEYIKDCLFQGSLIQDCLKDILSNIKFLRQYWQETSRRKALSI